MMSKVRYILIVLTIFFIYKSQIAFSGITFYKVKPKDTTYKICKKFYPDKDLDYCIAKLKKNNRSFCDPNKIYIGQILKIPTEEEKKGIEYVGSNKTKKNFPSEKKKGKEIEHIYNHIGCIEKIIWLNDSVGIVSGKIFVPLTQNWRFRLIVNVPGDQEYEQPLLTIDPNGTFTGYITVGRFNKDYNKKFIIKLVAIYNGKRVSYTSQEVVKRKRSFHETQNFVCKEERQGWVGEKGIEKWIEEQTIPSEVIDNRAFRIEEGLLIKNYHYSFPDPDARFLERYGRITLYGSSVYAKYILLRGVARRSKNDIKRAARILRVWLAQMDDEGRIPRSANVIGDNYISPQVRSGDQAHFLGALGLYLAASQYLKLIDPFYEEVIAAVDKLVDKYFESVWDSKINLIYGGFDVHFSGIGNLDYKRVEWISTEHNLDFFQALLFLSQIYPSKNKRQKFLKKLSLLGAAIDQNLWSDKDGTFYRGYRLNSGPDPVKALDCSSWGILYLVKQYRLTGKRFYLLRAKRVWQFIETHFTSQWCYSSGDDVHCINGYKPYSGFVPDLHEKDWNNIDLIWSEGTLGVVIAYKELYSVLSDPALNYRAQYIYREMLKLQKISKIGGEMYSTKSVAGEFTRGEELAALSWLGYATLFQKGLYKKLPWWRTWIPW